MRAASFISPSSFARAISVACCRASSSLSLPRGLDRALEEPRVLDGGRGLQGQRVQELQLGRGVRHGDVLPTRHDADHPLAHLQRRADERLHRRLLGDAPRVLVHVVDDLADAAGRHRPHDAAAEPEPRSVGISSPKPATAVELAGRLVEQHDHAVGGYDQVPRFLQGQLRHAVEVQQRRQLLGEAVDQVDLAVEVQHLGPERLALDLLRDQVLEQRGNRARARLRPGDPAQAGFVVEHGEPGARRVRRRVAVQEPARGVLDRDRRAERRGDGGDQVPGVGLAPDDVAQGDTRHATVPARPAPSAAGRRDRTAWSCRGPRRPPAPSGGRTPVPSRSGGRCRRP